MATKPLLSQTKAARIERAEARNAMYELVQRQSHGERYLRGMVLRGKESRTPEENLELTINGIVTNYYDMFSRADGHPETISDVMRGWWKARTRSKFSEMAAKDPSLLLGYPADVAKKYKNFKEHDELLGEVASDIAELLKDMLITICDIKLCEFREATGAERRTGEYPDKWMVVYDSSTGENTELLVRPIAKSRRRVKGTATINGKLFVSHIYSSTSYTKLFAK